MTRPDRCANPTTLPRRAETASGLVRSVVVGTRDLPAVGALFEGRFEVEREAGEGGMGTVYRATDRVTGSPVALKILRRDGGDRARFEREAAVLSEVREDAVVRYVAHGTGECPWLAMEWLEGEDLAARLLRGPIEWPSAVAMVVRGHSALTAMPLPRNSPASPSAMRLMPNLAME